MVLVGDPMQLRGAVHAVRSRKAEYQRSLFERLVESGHPVHLLAEQYRMDARISAFPNAEFYYNQVVYQFSTAKAATTFYGQAKTKYGKCRDFTESVPASTVPGSGKLETTVLSMSKTKVGKYQAFQLTQAVTLSESPGFSLDLNTLVAVEGTDVFTVVNLSGTNDPVPAGLMLKFINRVKKLR